MTTQGNNPDEGTDTTDPTQAARDQEFNDAWTEGASTTGPDDGAPTGDDTPTGDENSNVNTSAQTDEDPDQAGDQTPSDQEGAAEEDASLQATDGQPDAGGKPAESELTKAEKEELKRWQGRKAKAKEEAEAEEARLAKVREERAAAEAKKAEESEMSDEERAKLEEVRKDYPDIDRLIDAKVQKALKDDVPKVIDARVEPVSKRVDASARKAHADAIAAAHSDYEKVANSKDFADWLESGVSYKDGERYRQVIRAGSAKDVIDMFTSFKESRKPKPKQGDDPPVIDPRQRQRTDAVGAAVRHRSGGPAHRQRADKNDYDGAWDEASRASR